MPQAAGSSPAPRTQQRELHNNIRETFDILRRYSNMSVRVI